MNASMSRFATPEGWIDAATWLMFLKGDKEAVERYLFSPELAGEDRHRCFSSYLMLQHLTIHFWQAISTSFLFFYSSDRLGLCLKVLNEFAQGEKRYSDIPFRRFERDFADLSARLQTSAAA